MSKRLKVDFAGLELEHPVVAASAGATRDAEHCFRAQEAGFSAVILKSVQEEVVNRYNPLPRFALVKSGIPGYRAVSFFCYEQAGADAVELVPSCPSGTFMQSGAEFYPIASGVLKAVKARVPGCTSTYRPGPRSCTGVHAGTAVHGRRRRT